MATKKAYFETSNAAWVFFRAAETNGLQAGYPSLKPVEGLGYEVQYTTLKENSR